MVEGVDGYKYFVLDFQLQKRILYNYFQDWARTKDGKYFLHKYDHKRGSGAGSRI